jgi:DNA-directed RNA polymerase specialized sigma54-like protein
MFPAIKILEVLRVIQTFEPTGVGARDLRECLMIQLEREGQQESLEYEIVRDYMDALGKRRIPEIARGTGAPWRKSRNHWRPSRAWSRGRGGRFSRTWINLSCPKSS